MPTAAHFRKAFAGPVSKVCAFEKTSVCLLDDDLSMLKALGSVAEVGGLQGGKVQPSGGLSFQHRAGAVSGGNSRRLDAGQRPI
jgi:hypothetical protein